MKKRWLSLALAGIVGVSTVLTGCGGFDNKDNKSAKSGDKVLKLSIPEDIPTFDTAKISDNQSSFVGELTFENLVRMGNDNEPKPALAEKFESNKDATQYTFHLRDAKWSNGDNITANDFKFAWLRAMDPKTASDQAERFFPIKNAEKFYKGEAKADEVGITVKDDKTLVVDLETPDSLFVDKVAYATFAPLNKKALEANKDWLKKPTTQVFDGPFILTEVNLGSGLKFKKNEKYWDAKNVKINEIDVAIIKDPNTAYQKFINKELDIIGNPVNSLPIEKIEEYKKLPQYKQFPFSVIQWAKFNTHNKFLKNVHLRRAISYSVNRKAIIDGLLKNNGQKAMTGFNPATPDQGFWKDGDVEAAKKELEIAMKELGVSSPSDIKLEYRFNTNPDTEKIIQAIQEQVQKALGIKIELKNEEWKVYLDNISKGNYEIGRLGWQADVPDVSDFLNMYQKEDGGNNQTFWYNAEFDKLISQAKSETDQNKRKDMLRKAEKILADEMPVMPLYTAKSSYLIQDRVEGFTSNLLGGVDWKNLDLK